MQAILRIWATLLVAVKRILSQPGLALATVFGLVISISITMSIPMYADSIYLRLFRDNVLSQKESATSTATIVAPPLSFQFSYAGNREGLKEWKDVQAVDDYLIHQASRDMQLNLKQAIRYLHTDTFGLFPADTANFSDANKPLYWTAFASITHIEDHIQFTDGRFPQATDDGVIEAMLGESLADKLGLQAGENYIAYVNELADDGSKVSQQIPVRISGIWKATDTSDPYWLLNRKFLEERLVIPEGVFTTTISERINKEVYFVLWYLVMDDTELHYSQAAPLIGRITYTQQRAASIMENVKLTASPVDALERYRQNASLLTVQLFAYSLPLLGLLLAFISLTTSLSVDQRRNEIAVLRSRGARVGQMIGIAVLEGLILGLIGFVLSIPVSMGIVYLIGKARGFLDFSVASTLQIVLTSTTLEFGLLGVGLALISQVLPTIGAASRTVVTYKQERARSLKRPLWQRLWLDVAFFIPAAYGLYLLKQQGSIIIGSSNLFQNPLLFLVPVFGMLSMTFFFLRIMPLLMGVIAWIAEKTPSVGLLMAARHLGRTPGSYMTPLMLLVLTLSLSAFTASLAETVNRSLEDQTYYSIGADYRVLDSGDSVSRIISAFANQGSAASGDETTSVVEDDGPEWSFLPVTEYMEVPGVRNVSRVGRYPLAVSLNGATQAGVFMGVDRFEFSQIAFWRKDFSSVSLGELMNRLAITPDGVLVPASFAAENAIQVGDSFQAEVTTYGQRNNIRLTLVGTFDLFPTWYPSEDGILFVGNLENLFEMAGGQFPYQVWMHADPGLDPEALRKAVYEQVRSGGFSWLSAENTILTAQKQPDRQGLFGLLSVGFLASAVLTVMGFLLYALFSFRRRFVEFGVLRANGLSSGQMISFLAWELAFLIVMGGGVGTILGVYTSELFIPYLQVGISAAQRVPPFTVQLPWVSIYQFYGLFAGLFLAALFFLAALLRKMRIFQAIKLGETI